MSGRVGFIGLGIMGSRMAANLRRAGFELSVWNRTPQNARRFAEEHGARLAETPAEAAQGCDVVITMVVDGPQVESVLLGAEGAANGAGEDLLCVDMSTIGPSWAQRIGGALAERGVRFADAPVSGSSPKAEDGTLTIMVGGARRDYERALPLFEVMGEVVVHVGPLGHGQMVKLLNNAVAGINTAVVGEALLLGKRTGLDLVALVRVMSAGSGGSAMLDLKAGPMLRRDYTTLFKLEHMLKDLRLCLEEAETVGLRPRFVEETARVLAAADGQGHGEQDFAALVEALQEETGVRL